MNVLRGISRLFGLGRRVEMDRPSVSREPVDHVVILDGTMSTLDVGRETNAGIIYKLLCEARRREGARVSIKYEAGIQWRGFRHMVDVIAGIGLDEQIRRAYGFIASRYRPGDRIMLFGYSRGAFAVRSLAGFINACGLLRPEAATERNIAVLYRHYQSDPESPGARAFRARHCHDAVEIEFVGVFDTVKALGIRMPLLWRICPVEHEFHDHDLGPHIRHGAHALALDETRLAYEPVLWHTDHANGRIVQMWFRGSHADVGGQIGDFAAARPLANIPLVWMLERAEACGLPLPQGWRERFPRDSHAPAVGTWRGLGRLFLARRRRVALSDPSEHLHPSVNGRFKARLARLPGADMAATVAPACQDRDDDVPDVDTGIEVPARS